MSNASLIYAMPNVTNSEGFLGLIRFSNDASDGIFMPLMVLVIYAVLFMISINITSAGKAFAFTSFICAVLSMPLTVLGLFASNYMYLLFFLTGVGVVWMKLENS